MFLTQVSRETEAVHRGRGGGGAHLWGVHDSFPATAGQDAVAYPCGEVNEQWFPFPQRMFTEHPFQVSKCF